MYLLPFLLYPTCLMHSTAGFSDTTDRDEMGPSVMHVGMTMLYCVSLFPCSFVAITMKVLLPLCNTYKSTIPTISKVD